MNVKKQVPGRVDTLFALLLAGVAVLLFCKCPYGFGYYDESFYLVTARRFWYGDAPVAQEWNLAQFFALFTAPLYGLVERCNGGTEGILLIFRYLFVVVQLLASVFLYVRLRRLSLWGAGAAALCFALFAPYNVNALSYNSLGVLFLTLAGTLLATMQTRRALQTALAGGLFAGAVLCSPFLALGYGVLAVLFGRRRLGKEWFLPFTAGVAVLAVLFLALVFSRTDPILFVKGLKTMLQSTDRSSESFGSGLLFCTPGAPVLFAAFGVLGIVCWRDRNHRRRVWYLAGACLLAMGFQLSFWLVNPYINFFMFSINLCAPFAVAVAAREEDRRLLRWLWAPGLVYAFAISLASNQKFYAISQACAVAAVASVALLCRAAAALRKEPGRHAWAAVGLIVMLLAVQLVSQGVVRWYTVFWQEEPACLTVQLDRGPEAGLYTDAETAAQYNEMLDSIEPLKTLTKEQHVLFVSRYSWMYLATPAQLGGFSAWMQLNDGIREKSKDQLSLYYDRMPAKRPDAVFVERRYPDVVEYLSGLYGYVSQETASGWILTQP